MRVAIKEAKRAGELGDYAVGAVIVRGDKIISKESNRSIRDQSPIAHAETLAIIKASKIIRSRHLKDCIIYCTHEPCPMCASVVVWARLKGVVYGAKYEDMKYFREKNKNNKYLWRTIDISCKEVFGKSTEKIEVVKDFMRKECNGLFHTERLK